MSRAGGGGDGGRRGCPLGCPVVVALLLGCGPAAPPMTELRPALFAAHSAIYGGPGPAASAAARYDHLAGIFADRALTEAF